MMLGQLPGMDLTSQVAVSRATANLPASPPSCSWLATTWDYFANPNAWKACQIAQSQAMIQDVADRAAAQHGPDSEIAQVAQQAADVQKAQVPSDVGEIADYYGAGSLIQTPGQGMPTWVIAALLVGTLILLRK